MTSRQSQGDDETRSITSNVKTSQKNRKKKTQDSHFSFYFNSIKIAFHIYRISVDAKPPAHGFAVVQLVLKNPSTLQRGPKAATVHVTSSLYIICSIQKPVQNPAQREEQFLSDRTLISDTLICSLHQKQTIITIIYGTVNMGGGSGHPHSKTKHKILIYMVEQKHLLLHSHTSNRYSKSAWVLLTAWLHIAQASDHRTNYDTKKIMDRFIKWLLSLNYIFFPFFFKDRGAVPCALLYFIAFWHLRYCLIAAIAMQ